MFTTTTRTMFSLALLFLFHSLVSASPVPQSSSDTDPNAPDSVAGAAGSDGSAYNLSTGGLVAIIIVIVLVLIAGGATTALFLIAKRRQWTMRETIRRASRRFTGRGGNTKESSRSRATDRHGAVRMQSPPRDGRKGGRPTTLGGVNQLEKLKTNRDVEVKEFQQPKVKAILPPGRK